MVFTFRWPDVCAFSLEYNGPDPPIPCKPSYFTKPPTSAGWYSQIGSPWFDVRPCKLRQAWLSHLDGHAPNGDPGSILIDLNHFGLGPLTHLLDHPERV